jgi:hypothetical protein
MQPAAPAKNGHAGKAGMSSSQQRKRCLSGTPFSGIASDA